MTTQTLTLGKQRFIVLSERDYLKLQQSAGKPSKSTGEVNAHFAMEAMRQLRTYRRTRKAATWKDVREKLGI